MTFFIPGPAGPLEASHTANTKNDAPFVVICHPHPEHGGSMTNKVVTTASRAMQKLGASTVSFNFRGVGQSAGTFDNQIGEVDDALAVVDWAMAQKAPEQALWIAGFSFGAYIASRVANDRNDLIEQLLTLAPVLKHSDYQALTEIQCPWHAIVGDDDEFVTVDELRKFQTTHTIPMSLQVMNKASHYFHGQLIPLREHIIEHYSPPNLNDNDSQLA